MQMRNVIWSGVVIGLLFAGCSRKTEPQSPDPASADERSAASVAPRAQGVWMTDFEAAKVRAVEEGKDLLVDFTGSDWCYWCKKLDGEVFSKPGFIDDAGRDFVFVKVDFPSNPSAQPRPVRMQNQRLYQMYGVEGYPTVILMRADGRPYARTGYLEGGADAYLAHLKELRGQR